MRVEKLIATKETWTYRIANPCYAKDILEAIRWAQNDAKSFGIDTSFDNFLTVKGDDEGIVVSWEREIS